METIDTRTTEDFIQELCEKVRALEEAVSNLEDAHADLETRTENDIELLKDAVGDLENNQ